MPELEGINNDDASSNNDALEEAVTGQSSAKYVVTLDKYDDTAKAISNIEEILYVHQRIIAAATHSMETILAGIASDLNSLLSLPEVKDDSSSVISSLSDLFQKDRQIFEFRFSNLNKKNLSTLEKSASDTNTKNIIAFSTAVTGAIDSISGKEDKVSKFNTVIDSLAGGMEKLGEMGGKKIASAAMGIAAGIAILGLVAATVVKAVTYEDILKLALLGATFAGIAWMLGKSGGNSIKAALSIAILGMAIWAFSELVTPEMTASVAISLGMLGLVLWGFTKIAADPKTMLAAAISLAIFGVALWGISYVMNEFAKMDWEGIAKSGVVIGGLVAIMVALGIPAVSALALTGAATLAAVSGATLLLALSLNALAGVKKIDQSQLDTIKMGAEGMVSALVAIGNPLMLPFILAGTAAAVATSVGVLALSGALAILNTVSLPTEEQVNAFGSSTLMLMEVFKEIGGPIATPLIILGAASAVVMAGGTALLAGAIHLVGMTDIASEEHFEMFSKNVNILADMYKDVGGPIATPLILAGTVSAVAMAGATALTAAGIQAFSFMAGKPEEVDRSLEYLSRFINGTSEIFLARSSDDYDLIKQGIGSFAGVSTLIAGIARSVAGISSLRFEETEMRDGKLVVTGVRQFTPEDFAGVGTSIGMIVTSLTAPLAAVGASGGLFGNDVEDGIEALSGIGAIFMPISNIITTFADHNIDATSAKQFTNTMGVLVGGISSIFEKDSAINEDQIENLEDAIELLDDMVNLVVQEKVPKGAANIALLAENTNMLKDAVNGIELEKLTKFNDVLYNMSQLEEHEGFERLAEAIMALVEKIANIQKAPEVDRSVSTVSSTTNVNAQQGKVKNESENQLIELFSSGNEEVVSLLQQLNEILVTGQAKFKLAQSTI